MLSITIVDGDAAIATATVAPDLDEHGEDTGQHAPLVEFRVLTYSLLPAFERIRSVVRAAGDATLAVSRRTPPLSDAELAAAKATMQAGRALEARLAIRAQSGALMEGRVTMFREIDLGGGAIHSIGIALAGRHVHAVQ